MLIATCKKKGIKMTHVWFKEKGDQLSDIKTDILLIHGCNPEGNYAFPNIIKMQNTLITDLSVDEDSIIKNFSKTIQYQLRRVQKDGIEVSFYNSKDLLNNKELLLEFGRNYDKMFKQKGIKGKFNHDVVQAYIQSNMLTVATASYLGQVIVYHSYVVSDKRVRGLYSVSVFRDKTINSSLIGRANKYLHYKGMIYFKNKGVHWYDWAGISSFDNPNGVDKFKLEFGGNKHVYANVVVGQSLVGKAIVILLKILSAIREK